MIYLGDLFDVLPKLAAESIDSCVTDPPYGVGIMGKEWDTFKPGATESAPNQAIKSDNPNLKGRQRSPASSPSSIAYDRRLSGQRAFQTWTERWAREVFRVLKPGAHILVCGAPRSFHRMTSGLEDAGFEVRDCFSWLYGQGFPKSFNLSKAFDQALGVEREVVGVSPNDRPQSQVKGGKAFDKALDEGQEHATLTITKSESDEAKKWNGWGTALKPSWEPIILARKPLIDTLVVNVAMHGTGALNVDACRIGEEARFNPAAANDGTTPAPGGPVNVTGYQGSEAIGRWPPNVLLNEESALLLDAQTGALKASRFMYVAKPSGAERDEGCYDLTPRTPMDLTGRKEGSAGLKHARAGTDRKATNHHPTVKPVTLMQWLVTLVTPPGGTALDPFMGSGTTGMAARLADLQFVGVEREADYVEIARRRISDTNALFSGEEEVIS